MLLPVVSLSLFSVAPTSPCCWTVVKAHLGSCVVTMAKRWTGSWAPSLLCLCPTCMRITTRWVSGRSSELRPGEQVLVGHPAARLLSCPLIPSLPTALVSCLTLGTGLLQNPTVVILLRKASYLSLCLPVTQQWGTCLAPACLESGLLTWPAHRGPLGGW